jgi:hypothetical protein
MTTTTTIRPRRNWWQFAGYIARRATMMELHGYQSIYRFVFRRPKVPAGGVGFGYHKLVLPILIVFVVVSALEMLVVDLIVRRWAYIRVPLLILSIWGIVYMLGLLFGMIVRPHAITADGIRVRYGSEIEIPIAWEDVDSVVRRKRVNNGKQPKVTSDENGEASLHMRIQNETNIEIRLNRPVSIRLPHGTETVSTVNLYADDPKGFTDEVRNHR